jgi:DNA-binding NarL/FixJ family response regulator
VNKEQTRVLIVEDHVIVAKGLQALLETEGFVVKIATRGHDALLLVEKDCWDVVLLDILLPDMNGLDVLGRIKHIRPSAKILILTGESEKRYGMRAFKAGSKGFLRKDCPYNEALEAIKKVARGETYVTECMAEHLALSLAEGSRGAEASHEDLSSREYEVVLRLAAGMSVKEIGAELNIARQTVSTHRRKALDKLGLDTDASLVRYAVVNDLISA